MKTLTLIALTLTIIALLMCAAYTTRGGFGIGGEWFIWIAPAIIYAARNGGLER